MSKHEFLKKLRRKLKPLPKEERDSAIAFYEDYFNDAESEEMALSKLSSPNEIAAKLLIEFGEKKQSVSTTTIILAILSAPMTIPLGIVGASLIFTIVVVLGAFIFSLYAVNFALALCAIVSFISIIPAFIYNFATGCIYLGSFLLSVPLTFGFFIVCNYLAKKLITLIRSFTVKILKRRYENEQ